MSILLGLEPFQKFGVGGGGWWSIGILEFRFGTNLRLGAWSLDQAEQKLKNLLIFKKNDAMTKKYFYVESVWYYDILLNYFTRKIHETTTAPGLLMVFVT